MLAPFSSLDARESQAWPTRTSGQQYSVMQQSWRSCRDRHHHASGVEKPVVVACTGLRCDVPCRGLPTPFLWTFFCPLGCEVVALERESLCHALSATLSLCLRRLGSVSDYTVGACHVSGTSTPSATACRKW